MTHLDHDVLVALALGDREMTSEERQHVTKCGECRVVLKVLQQVGARLATLDGMSSGRPVPALPAGRARLAGLPVWIRHAAAMLLAALLGGWIGSSLQSGECLQVMPQVTMAARASHDWSMPVSCPAVDLDVQSRARGL